MEGIVARIRSWPPRVWIALALLVLIIVFIVQNRQDSVVHLVFITFTAPMWITLAITLVVGILIGVLAARRRKGARA
ncbi:DUF1049 domain-containing protein [Nonomuraea sp. NPDC050663]|uniref:DUF1049 domain-containing protein n=1 Tax=Nonomuraea sp. NPDC050663 TaxID=3364370 RepID=UPI003790AC3A